MTTEVKRFTLNNVRLSFSSIWERAVFEGKPTKYEGTFLINKEEQSDQMEKIEAQIKAALIEKFGELKKVPKNLLGNGEKVCYRDGDESEYDGYEGHMSFKASNKMQPSVLNLNKEPLTEDDNLIYSGCYVDAVVDIWIQNHPTYRKRVNANLYAIRYRSEGTPFGGGRIPKDVESDFEDLDMDEDLSQADI